MKTLKTSSAYFLRTIEKFTFEFGKSSQRISSGLKLPQDAPFSLHISRDLKNKIDYLDFISTHITKTTNILQKYEEVLNSANDYIIKLKDIAERAVFETSPSELKDLENSYIENLQQYINFIRSERIFGRNIARGGFSNEVLSIEVISGEISLSPRDLDASGVNFRKYGIGEEDTFFIELSRNGNIFSVKIIVNNVVVDSESKEIQYPPDNMPFKVDFLSIGVSVQIPRSSGDFQVKFKVGAQPILSLFGEGKDDFEKFFLPSLEPEDLGLPSNFEGNPELAVEKIKKAIERLSEIKAEIGGKLDKLKRRAELNQIIQAKSKIFAGNIEDTDMPSEAVILSLKQTLLSVDFSVAQRAISMLSSSIEMMRR